MRGWTLRAVPSAASWMDRIALELANLIRIFVHVGKQAASRFTVEANRRHERVPPGDAFRPLLAIPFDPVIPSLRRWVLADAAIRMDDFCQLDGLAIRGGKLWDRSACRSGGDTFCFSHKYSILDIRHSNHDDRISNFGLGVRYSLRCHDEGILIEEQSDQRSDRSHGSREWGSEE